MGRWERIRVDFPAARTIAAVGREGNGLCGETGAPEGSGMAVYNSLS